MDPKNLDGLPTVIADMESLRQQLAELHATVKGKGSDRPSQAGQSASVGMVIKGK